MAASSFITESRKKIKWGSEVVVREKIESTNRKSEIFEDVKMNNLSEPP